MSPALDWVFALSSAHAKVFKALDRQLSLHGLSFSEFLVLHHLSQAPDRKMRRIDLADAVELSPSGVTRLLTPMEKRNLVEKEPNPRDARVSLVRLADAGLQTFTEATATVEKAAKALLEPLGKESVEAFLAMAGKIR